MTAKIITILSAALLFFVGCLTAAQANHTHDMQGMSMGKSEEPVVVLKTDPVAVKTGAIETITVEIRDAAGKPVQDLTKMHDRIMHVIIASSDFSVFSHIHPEDFGPITAAMKETARYPVHFTFPKAGRYIIGIDLAVKDEAYSKHFIVDAAGGPAMGSPVTDLSRNKKYGDYNVMLTTMPPDIVAGKETMLTYHFEKAGVPVTDLEPYIAAVMHVAVISTDLKQFIHEHGSVPGMPVMEMQGHHMMHEMPLPSKFGPEINVPVTFPAAGLYKIFGEVKHKGKVILTDFMVEVK